jgi:hypothetical protein
MSRARQRNRAADGTRDSLLMDTARYQKKLRSVLEKEKKAGLSWLSDQLSQEALQQIKASLGAERAFCEEQIVLARTRLSSLDRMAITIDAMAKLKAKIGEKLDGADFARQRWILSQMFARILIYPDRAPPEDVELEVALGGLGETDIEKQTPRC